MKKVLIWGTMALMAASLLFTSCKRTSEADTDTSSAEDQSQGEMVYDQVYKQVDESANTKGLQKGAYPVIQIDTTAAPRTMSIYYGDSNYLCNDGSYRRGTIIVSWTGRYRATGTIISISFSNFYQNDNKVEGTKTVTNNGRNAAGLLSFTVVVNGKITCVDGLTHTWNSNRTRTWISGETTLISSDDVYEISGTTNGVNRKGLTYNAVITKNLKVDLSCEWRITSGIIEITPSGKAMRSIDFGNGACDKLITISMNGKSKTIERRK